MAHLWSFGIKFNNLEDAEKAKSMINNVTLSDNTEVPLIKQISYHNDNSNLEGYTLGFMLQNMQMAGDPKLFSYPFFFEIRDAYYQFLHKLKINFLMAHFEFEGEDRIAHDDIINDINKYGLGEILNSDNCPDLNVSDTIYQNKRILDGLVLSEDKLLQLNTKYAESFKPFKSGYYWLPVENYQPDNVDLQLMPKK